MDRTAIRLNRYLAQQGLCSRRQADRLIQEGQVEVNGAVETNPARHVEPGKDKVTPLFTTPEYSRNLCTIAFHKPRGVVVTHSTREGPNIYSYLRGLPAGLEAIGRLDKDSEGLILLSNDSSLPRYVIGENSRCPKYYEVVTDLDLPDSALDRMRRGMQILGEKTRPAKVTRLGPRRFSITLTEGKNRQIRRMCRTLGAQVEQLKRLSIGPVHLDSLPPGQWRELDKTELEILKS